MTSTASLIASARRWLQSSGRPEYNRLTDAIDADDTAIELDFALGGIAPNAILGIDLEEVLVWAAATPSATSVQRGWNGSVAASHSAGTVVEVNQMFSAWRILNELNAELESLSSPITGLRRVKTVATTATVASTYNLAADVVDILAVQYNDVGPSNEWPLLRRWDLLHDQDTAVFPSGKAITLFEMPSPGRTIRVTYSARFGTLSTLTDDVEATTGLPESAHDIPAIGAAARLLASRESRRSQLDAQPEARRAADVPPGTARSAAAQLFALRDRRVREEAARFAALYPSMRRVG